MACPLMPRLLIPVFSCPFTCSDVVHVSEIYYSYEFSVTSCKLQHSMNTSLVPSLFAVHQERYVQQTMTYQINHSHEKFVPCITALTCKGKHGPAVRADFRRLYPANAKTPTCCPSDDNRTKVTNCDVSTVPLVARWPVFLARGSDADGGPHYTSL